MDANRFDALAKSLTVSVSRRTSLSGLIAGLVAPLLVDPAAATRRKRHGKDRHPDRDANHAARSGVGIEKKKPKKKKKKNPAPCAAACAGKPPCADNGCGNPCESCTGAGQTCGGGGVPGVCGCSPLNACPLGQNCGTVPDGCGGTVSCGACTSPQTCGGGGTPGVCGSAGCIRNCQNANGTPRSCGDDGCGGSCGPCVGDNYECEPIFGFCGCRLDNDIAPCDGLCVNVRTSQEHCGGCNTGCHASLTCCDARCANLLRDNGNCGECGVVCPLPGDGGARYACCNGSCFEDDRCPGE